MNLFDDGFDHYINIYSKWTGAFQCVISTTAARNGPQGLYITAGGGANKSLPYSSEIFYGAAYQPSGGLTAFGGTAYSFGAGAVGGGIVTLFSVKVENDGSISLLAGSTGTPFANTALLAQPFYLSTNTFFYIEASCALSGSDPISVSGTLRVNGVTLMSGSGTLAVNVTSLMPQAAEGNVHNLGGIGGGATWVDDVYINNGTPVTNAPYANTFRGDIRVGPFIVPRSDQVIQLTPLTAGPSYSEVNETPPDGDGSYVYGFTSGLIDTWFMTTVPSFSGEIQAVQICAYLRKDNEGTRTVSPVVGGSVPAGAPTWSLSDSYLFYTWALDVDPTTGLAWTVAGVNGQTFGIQIN